MIVEVRLDRGWRAVEPVRDLPDREALALAVMAREDDRTPALNDSIETGRGLRSWHHDDGTSLGWRSRTCVRGTWRGTLTPMA